MILDRLADLRGQLPDPGDDRLERVEEPEDDLASSEHLKLAGTTFCPAA